MKKLSIYGFGLILLLIFISLNMAVFLFGSSQVFDITPEKRYTLDVKTIEWLNNNQKKIYMRLYKSASLKRLSPQLDEYAAEVLKVLEQYKNNANHKLGLQIVETEPFSIQADEAIRLGVKKLTSDDEKQSGMLGLVISDEDGNMEAIPYLKPERRNYLEQDISRILSNLEPRKRMDIGVLSPAFKIMPDVDAFDYAQTWPIIDFLQRDYDLTYVPAEVSIIPDKIDVLLVVNPMEMSNLSLYAIDQYLMNGGRVIMMLEGLSEYMINNAIRVPDLRPESFVTKFLARYGLNFRWDTIVGDRANSRKLSVNDKETFPFWLRLNRKNFAEHPITKGVGSMKINTPAGLEIAPQENITTTVLATSGEHGIEMNNLQFARNGFNLDSGILYPTEKSYPMAVLFEGEFTSYFSEPYIDDVNLIPYVSIGLEKAALLVLPDTDWLLSENWNSNEDNDQSWYDVVPNTGNVDFLMNAIDYLSKVIPPVMAEPKQSKYAPFSLGQMFSFYAHESMETERQKVLDAQNVNKSRLQEINHSLAANELLPSLQLTKEVDLLTREKMRLQEELQKIEHQTLERYKVIVNIYLLINIGISMLLIGLIALLHRQVNRRLCHKIKGYINE